MESSSAQAISTIIVHLRLNYDTNAALTQIQAKVAQVRNDLPPEAEAPENRAGNGGPAVRRDLPGVLVDRPRSESDHRLSDARRPAEAQRHQRRSARRHPRRPHVRHADLAESRSDGRARHLAVGGAGSARSQQLPLGARAHEGVDGVGQPDRQHRSPDARRIPAARRERREGRGRAPWRNRRRRAGRGELRRRRPLQRRGRHVHGRVGAANGELARRGWQGARGDAGRSRPSCRPA